MNEVEYLTYEQILAIDDTLKREVYLTLYEQIKTDLLNSYPDYIDEFDSNLSLQDNYYKFEEMQVERQSNYIFPGNLVNYYAILKEVKAKRCYICAYSGAPIYPGERYQIYKAFLYNLTRHEAWVSNPIRLECNSDFEIPRTLEEYETFMHRLDHAYELDLKQEYNMQTNTGGINLQRLRRKN